MNSREKGKREWKPIKSLGNLYEASEDGLIRSVKRLTTRGVILRQTVSKANGYSYVSVSIKGTMPAYVGKFKKGACKTLWR